MSKIVFHKTSIAGFILAFLLSFSGGAEAQTGPIGFRMTGASVMEKDTFTVAILADTLLTGRAVLSYRFYLTYSPSYYEFIGTEGTGPVLDSWGVPVENSSNAGTVILAGAGSEALTGTGVMVYLKFRSLRSGNAYISFTAAESYLNEGNPPSSYTNGYITSAALSYPNIYPDQQSMSVGNEVQMTTSGGVGPYVYTTGNPAVALVTSGDIVRAVGPGITKVTVTDSQGESSTTTGLFDVRAITMDLATTAVWPADTFFIPVRLQVDPGTTVYSGRFDLAHSTALAGLPGDIVAGDFQVFIENNPKSGRMTVSFASTAGITGNGVLCYLSFRANTSGNQYIRFENMRFNENLYAWASQTNYYINVKSLPTLSMSPNSGTLLWGETLKLNVYNGTAPYTYSVSDTDVATIDEQGNFTTISGGQVRVTATDDNGATMTSGLFTVTDHQVSVYSTEGVLDTETRVPILSTSLPTGKGLYGFQAGISFDETYLTFVRAEAANGNGLVQTSQSGSSVQIAGAYAQGLTSGVIGYLIFNIKNALVLNGSTTVTLNSFSANENSLFTTLQNGSIKRVEQTSYRPVAIAGLDFSLQEGASGQLDGSASFDLDNDPLTYSWTPPQGFVLDDNTSATPGFTAPYVSENTSYTFKLVVNDGTDNSDTAMVNVTVLQVNFPPEANAGADLNFIEGSSVTLDGSNSFDPDGDALSYSWKALDAIILFNPTSPSPSFILPQVTQNTGYRFTLVVNDGAVNSGKDTVTITAIQVNKKPVAFAGGDFSVNENEQGALDGSLSFDADSDPITYQWTAPASVTLSASDVAQPTFTAPPVLRDSVLNFQLVVNDGSRDSDPDNVQVSIVNLDILNTEVLIESLSMPELDSFAVDTTLALVTLHVPYGTDIRSLAPDFTLSQGASINPPGNSSHDFSMPVYYTVTAEDGFTARIWKVVVYQPERTVRRSLLSGWNWVSLNIQPADRNISALFGGLALTDLDYVKSAEYSSVYYDATGWFGNLVTFPQNRYVKFMKSIAGELTVTGTEINPGITSIPLAAGWNDIAYILSSDEAIDKALKTSSIPDGDVLIKGPGGSSIYYTGTGWVGDIDSLKVLHGYKLFVQNPGDLMFGYAGSKKKDLARAGKVQQGLMKEYGLQPEKYENSATLIAEAVSATGHSFVEAGDVVLAFHGDEVRGVSEARFVPEMNKYLFILTYFSNEENEEMSFKLKRSKDDKAYGSNLLSIFKEDDIIGEVHLPYTLVFDVLDLDVEIMRANRFSVYPNPVTEHLTIESGSDIRAIRLYDITGKYISVGSEGGERVTLSFKHLVQGIYTLEIETDNGVIIRKIIKTSN